MLWLNESNSYIKKSWWESARDNLHKIFINVHSPIKPKQELRESWQARICMGVYLANISCNIVDEESARENFNPHSPIKRKKSCERVPKTWKATDVFLNYKITLVFGFSSFHIITLQLTLQQALAWCLSKTLHRSFFNSLSLVERQQDSHQRVDRMSLWTRQNMQLKVNTLAQESRWRDALNVSFRPRLIEAYAAFVDLAKRAWWSAANTRHTKVFHHAMHVLETGTIAHRGLTVRSVRSRDMPASDGNVVRPACWAREQ